MEWRSRWGFQVPTDCMNCNHPPIVAFARFVSKYKGPSLFCAKEKQSQRRETVRAHVVAQHTRSRPNSSTRAQHDNPFHQIFINPNLVIFSPSRSPNAFVRLAPFPSSACLTTRPEHVFGKQSHDNFVVSSRLYQLLCYFHPRVHQIRFIAYAARCAHLI